MMAEIVSLERRIKDNKMLGLMGISIVLYMQSIYAVLLREMGGEKSICAYIVPKRKYLIFYYIDNKRVINWSFQDIL